MSADLVSYGLELQIPAFFLTHKVCFKMIGQDQEVEIVESLEECIHSFFKQQLKRRRMALPSSSSPAGVWRARPSRRWWLSTRPLVLSSTSCPSAPSSSPWRSSTTPNTAPSSTTHPCCLATGEPPLSTGEWCSCSSDWSVTTVTSAAFIPAVSWHAGPWSMVTKRAGSQCSGLMMDWTPDQSCCRESVTLNQMTPSTLSTRDFSSQRESKAQ